MVVSISGDLFSTAYNKYIDSDDTSNNPTIYTANKDSVSVKASSEHVTDENGKNILNNVVAPGTKNDVGINVSVTGTPETDCQLTYNLSEFQTIALYGGYGTIYGLMVPFEKGVVNTSNFKEIVEDGMYIGSGTSYQTYTKVPEGASFDEDADYFKLKDTVRLEPGQIYMPVKYYIHDKKNDKKIALNQEYKASGVFDSGLFHEFAQNTFDGCGSPGICVGHVGNASGTKVYNTNEVINENFSITWEWPYHQTTDTTEELEWCNACDTILGYIAAGKNVVKAEIESDGTIGDYDNNLMNQDSEILIIEGNENYNLDIIFDYSITVNQVD